MTRPLWQSAAGGRVAAAGFGLCLRLARGADLRATVRPALMVAVLAAAIPLFFRTVF